MQVPLETPWTAPRAPVLDAKTLGGFMDDHFRTRAGREMADIGVRAVWTCDPDELSLLHALFYLRSGGLLDRLLAVWDGAQQDRFVGGSQELSLRMAKALAEPVRLACPVRRIQSEATGVVVETDTETLHAKFAVLTAQPALIRRIDLMPPLPAPHAHLLDRLTGTAALKMMAVYPKPFWRRAGLSGQSASDTGPYEVTFDNSPSSGTPGVLMTFAEGRHALDLRQRTKEERRLLYLEHLARLFGAEGARVDGVPGARLGGRSMVARLPVAPAARRVDCSRPRAARTSRAHPFCRLGTRHALGGLHGWRRSIRRGSRERARSTAGKRKSVRTNEPAPQRVRMACCQPEHQGSKLFVWVMLVVVRSAATTRCTR
jgi:hypothetical protein